MCKNLEIFFLNYYCSMITNAKKHEPNFAILVYGSRGVNELSYSSSI